VSNQSVGLRDKRPRHTWAFTDAVKSDRWQARFRLIPLRVEFGARLTRSAPLGLEEDIPIESHLAFEHVIDGPAQFIRQEAQGFAFVRFFLQAGQIFLPRLVVAQKQSSRFGKGPLEMRIADLFA
jgi:hypothetical protein